MSSSTMQLHAALIWGGEPIADVVLDKPGPITIGPVANATFTVPDLGLPELFSIVAPGERGYLLTMGSAMSGTVSVGGVRKQVTDLVGAAPFAATPVGAGDWGVVDLDRGGALQLFFQLAPAPEAVPARRALDLETMLPAAAFSVLLHVMLLIATFGLYTAESTITWPGPRAMTGNYIVSRLIEQKPTPPVLPTPIVLPPSADKPEAPSQVAPPRKEPVASKGRDGDKGGPKAKPDATDDISPRAIDVAMLSPANRKLLDQVTNSPVDMTKWTKTIGRGMGRAGTGPGDGDEDLPPGTPKGQDGGHGYKKQGDLDTEKGAHEDGGGRCKGDKCSDGNADGPPGKGEIVLPDRDKIILDPENTLDPKVIQERIERKRGPIRACYQREYNRNQKLGGRISTKFVIAPDGHVTSVKIVDSALGNEAVESCLKRQLMSITFPASDKGGIVKYPFVFNGGK